MYIREQQRQRLVLASRSPSRRAILRGAGITFEIAPADLDETALLKELLKAGAPIDERAAALAEAKARAIAIKTADPEAIVIGSDQILDLEGDALEGPRTVEEAEARLKALRGRRHDLVCGLAVLVGSVCEERLTERVAVYVRDFSDDELDRYLQTAPPEALQTVGAYTLEGLGARLIERIEGDWFSALGLPLWALQKTLRRVADMKGS